MENPVFVSDWVTDHPEAKAWRRVILVPRYTLFNLTEALEGA